MPIHLIWGNDCSACERAIETLIKKAIDPAWSSMNLSRLDGSADSGIAMQALEEARTPPFGNGARVVLLMNSPFLNNCPRELAECFEEALELIPEDSYLVLRNSNKPDNRLRTTKAIQKLLASKKASEQSFVLPATWDAAGQKNLVERTAKELGITIEPEAASLLVEAIGNDSSRLSTELQKLSLHAEIEAKNPLDKNQAFITSQTVRALTDGIATNALEVGNALVEGDAGTAILLIDALLEDGEPALRILATLTSQIRGLLWVNLLEQQGEKDVAVIAKAAGISNPKRIYFLRKQLKGRSPQTFLALLGALLEIEVSIKSGVQARDAFREFLLNTQNRAH